MVLAPGGDIAVIENLEARADGSVKLAARLSRADGTLVGQIVRDLQGSCDDRAKVMATYIAAWESQPLPSPAAETVGPGADIAGKQNGGNCVVALPRSRIGVTLGASAGAAWIGGTSAIGGMEVAVGGIDSRWQLRLAGMVESAREQRLEGGAEAGGVSWQHTSAAVGPMRSANAFGWRFAVDAGPILGWATLVGQGNARWDGRQQRVFEYGGGVGIRAERRWGRFGLWLEWRTHAWAENQKAVLDTSQSSATLSRFDMMASLGASARVYP
jgi:hypothetical protein